MAVRAAPSSQDIVRIRSPDSSDERNGRILRWNFTGTVAGDPVHGDQFRIARCLGHAE